MTDLQIIEHLKDGRYSKAVRGLYFVYPYIKKIILANNGTKGDAEDVFQDALVILYKNINTPGFILSASIKTYLVAIVKNLWNNIQRKNKRMILVDDPLEVAVQTKDDTEEMYKLAELAFTLLEEKCRKLLIAFYFKKQSFSQIAKSLSFSNEQVAKNQKYRCIQKAKENYLGLVKKKSYE